MCHEWNFVDRQTTDQSHKHSPSQSIFMCKIHRDRMIHRYICIVVLCFMIVYVFRNIVLVLKVASRIVIHIIIQKCFKINMEKQIYNLPPYFLFVSQNESNLNFHISCAWICSYNNNSPDCLKKYIQRHEIYVNKTVPMKQASGI